MKQKLWEFSDNFGSFESGSADKIKTLYFPLANEKIMSSVSPDLHGDIKTGQDSFLLQPASRIDLTNLKSSRNFWIYINKDKIWSASGVSKDLRQTAKDKFKLQAGLLWHKVSRENKEIGLKAEILSFVPAADETVEIMQVTITNITQRKIKFIPTAAIPIYARSAENLRDHRHVTSLLQRIKLHKFGVIVRPTLIFNEAGHFPNKLNYFVLGWDEKFNPPRHLYPTQEMFCAEAGDLEAPLSILENRFPAREQIQGKEAMGALRFQQITLAAGKSHTYIIIMGISEDAQEIRRVIEKFKTVNKVRQAFKSTRIFWLDKSQEISLRSENPDFDNWFRWVSIQPDLRRIFGCSFLPDFDYGKGGRGWRDLWQDSLTLVLSRPQDLRKLLINNFSGVRIDGSNATIIGKKPGEFIADRNKISRAWMDHAIWPLITLDLYLNETGDYKILFEEATYFRDHQVFRAKEIDRDWSPVDGQKLKASSGKIYSGTILEHLLVENLVQFFNVGRHNHIRLEDADWNDGLDMASKNGESVTFSCMYAFNLNLLADLLLKICRKRIEISKELNLLLGKVNYDDSKAKQGILNAYFRKTNFKISGEKIAIDSEALINNLRGKAEWMANHIRKTEWLSRGFFNGYYDNQARRVEGLKKGVMRMMLASQVFPIMGGVAKNWQVKKILKNIQRYLFDKKLKGYRLNTDFSRTAFKTSGGIPPLAGREEQPHLGRGFSFAYGNKENGAFFNHMNVMFAYALYKCGFVKEGWQALHSIYRMSTDREKSRIYPCLPEYFDAQGKGMYAYLTGSASWFVLTLLTQAFGIRGRSGDLLIEPKLGLEQFKHSQKISINRIFAGRRLQISFFNPRKLDYDGYKIIKVELNSRILPLEDSSHIVIERKAISSLPAQKINTLNISLGPAYPTS